jgi:hypothetical protein
MALATAGGELRVVAAVAARQVGARYRLAILPGGDHVGASVTSELKP